MMFRYSAFSSEVMPSYFSELSLEVSPVFDNGLQNELNRVGFLLVVVLLHFLAVELLDSSSTIRRQFAVDTLGTFRRVSTCDGYGTGSVLGSDESIKFFTLGALDLRCSEYTERPCSNMKSGMITGTSSSWLL